jgi:hypothetical protein
MSKATKQRRISTLKNTDRLKNLRRRMQNLRDDRWMQKRNEEDRRRREEDEKFVEVEEFYFVKTSQRHQKRFHEHLEHVKDMLQNFQGRNGQFDVRSFLNEKEGVAQIFIKGVKRENMWDIYNAIDIVREKDRFPQGRW